MVYEDIVAGLQVGLTGFALNVVQGVIAFVILVLLLGIGIYIAKLVGKLIKKFFVTIHLEKLLEEHHLHDAFVGFTLSGIATVLVQLYIVMAFLGIAADVVNVPVLSYFSLQAINYFPLLVQGLVILLFALMAGDYLSDRIKTSKKIPFANNVALLIDFFIAYNALVIVLPLLFPAANPTLLIWSFMAVLTAFVLAFGLGAAIAIGLGLKDTVAEVAKKNKDKFSKLL